MKRFLSIFLAALMLLSCTVIVSAEGESVAITKHPTVLDPSVEVDDESAVEGYQWQILGEPAEGFITDETGESASTDFLFELYGDPPSEYEVLNPVSSYDSEKGWAPAVMSFELDDGTSTQTMYYFVFFGAYFASDSHMFVQLPTGFQPTIIALVREDRTMISLDSLEESTVSEAYIEEGGFYTLVVMAAPSENIYAAASGTVASFASVDGETESTLSAVEMGNTYRCAITTADGVLYSKTFKAEYEILSQPTVDDPTFEVTFEEDASFQWYYLTESTTNIDDTMADIDETYPASYDAETQTWTPYCYEPHEYSGYQEYQAYLFYIELNAGDTIRITLSNPDAASPADSDFRFYGKESSHDVDLVDGVVEFEAPENDVYEVYHFCIYPETTTYKIELLTFDYNELEGETEKTLKNAKVNEIYAVTAAYEDGTELTSDPVVMAPYVIKQPTVIDPTFEVAFEDQASFQWYSLTEKTVNVDETYVNLYGLSTSYDAETQTWTPQYGDPYEYSGYQECIAKLFTMNLQKGEVIKITMSNPDAISPADPDFRFFGIALDISIDVEIVDGVIVFEVPESDTYELYQYCAYPETTTYQIELSTFDYNELEGETEKTLKNVKAKERYAAIATYEDGTELASKSFVSEYAIIKQPTPDNISVEVNYKEDVESYKWFYATITDDEITDEHAESVYYEGETVGAPSYYDAENGCWVGSFYRMNTTDGRTAYEYDFFNIYLEEGQCIKVVLNVELVENYIHTMVQNGDDIEFGWTYEDGEYYFTAPASGTYSFYADTYSEEHLTFEASFYAVEVADEPIEGETESALSKPSLASYICVITYKDGTTLVSKPVTSVVEYEEMLGDVDGDDDIDQFDYLLVKRAYFNTYALTADETNRADVDSDSDVDQMDYLYIKRHYFGTYVIG